MADQGRDEERRLFYVEAWGNAWVWAESEDQAAEIAKLDAQDEFSYEAESIDDLLGRNPKFPEPHPSELTARPYGAGKSETVGKLVAEARARIAAEAGKAIATVMNESAPYVVCPHCGKHPRFLLAGDPIKLDCCGGSVHIELGKKVLIFPVPS